MTNTNFLWHRQLDEKHEIWAKMSRQEAERELILVHAKGVFARPILEDGPEAAVTIETWSWSLLPAARSTAYSHQFKFLALPTDLVEDRSKVERLVKGRGRFPT